jgi:Zn-finger nucleic acid-binding protein
MTPTTLRLLVACPRCKRQFDATGIAPRSQFHCSCGEPVEVPEARVRDAAVVRCSSCSAPRQAGSLSCAHCRADYTLHEQDLHTICSGCMTRVSDRARFCHRCATPITPQGRVGDPAAERCPACGPGQRLTSRRLGDPAIGTLECPRCAGLWLGGDALRLVTDRARAGAAAAEAALSSAPVVPGAPVAAKSRTLYRRCPFCNRHMNRRNFGRTSGIVIDSCKDHGVWFDARELESILAWIRAGGEQATERRDAEERRERERKEAIANPVLERAQRQAGAGPRWGAPDEAGALGRLLGSLFDL